MGTRMNCLDWLRTPRVMQSLKIKVLIWMCYTILVKHNKWEILTLSSCNLREHLGILTYTPHLLLIGFQGILT
ncbi:hypothetical protein LOK49_LG06G01187 [Camellia lanceoleosa]|uniref:Uncharacterized protein n=1 Tax=Camellia lanceoleosa TaxID=1840588 RepID=A0ACC0HCD8_9ERIC|nr:hypothetical protein LOK49_LG06G01187 [Camellia lanceoleosa]